MSLLINYTGFPFKKQSIFENSYFFLPHQTDYFNYCTKNNPLLVLFPMPKKMVSFLRPQVILTVQPHCVKSQLCSLCIT